MTISPFLRDLAKAHQQHEGWYPGSKSYRQNNPGNLRGPNGVFETFTTYEAGFGALCYDLQRKIFGEAGSILRYRNGTGKRYEELVFQEYVAIYAPSADNNNPVRYCEALCYNLARYNLTPDTPLSVMAQLVRGDITSVAATRPTIPMEVRYEMVKNALRWAEPGRRSMLLRLKERIERWIEKLHTLPK